MFDYNSVFVYWILSFNNFYFLGVLSLGFLSFGVYVQVDLNRWGFCPMGFLSLGVYVQWGFCLGVYVPGVFVQWGLCLYT